MLDASADVFAVFVVGQRGGAVAHGTETVLLIGAAVHIVFQLVEVVLFAVLQEFDEGDFIFEMVEDDVVLVEDVEQVGGIVFGLRLVLHVDVLEVAHGVEGGVAIESAVGLVGSLDVETLEELVDEPCGVIAIADGTSLLLAIGELHHAHTVSHRHAADGVEADERTGVFAVVIVGAFHQRALRIGIAHSQINAHGCVEVAQNLLGGGVIVVHGCVVAIA